MPTNARITTNANIMFAFLYSAMSANTVATIMTSMVQETSLIPQPFRHVATSRVAIFAIVATLIRPRYILKGVCTKNFVVLFVAVPVFILCVVTMSTAKKHSITSTEIPTYV